MKVFSVLALATSGIRGDQAGLLTGLCERCYEGGTEKCSAFGKCLCKEGFEGLYCNSCSDGYFGESCSHAESCCSDIIADSQETSLDRVRRASTAFTYDDYRRNALDEVKDRIDDLYEDFFMVPKVDDLSEFLKHINLRVLDVIHMISNLKGTSNGYGKKEETYYTWKDETQKKIFDLMERLSLQEINRTDIVAETESFKTLIADLESLRGVENDLENTARDNDLVGIALERDVGTEIKKMLKAFDDDELVAEKKKLVDDLNVMHENMTDHFFENGTMVFNDAEIIAEELSQLVSNSSNRLPHGYPNASSWLEEAFELKEIMVKSNIEAEEVMTELHELHASLKESIANLTRLTKDATNWRNEVIDERDLVAYIDLMFFMQKNYLSPEEKNKADELIQEIVKNWQSVVDQNFAEVFTKLQRMNPIKAKALTDDAAELQRKSEQIRSKLEEIKNLTDATGLINSETQNKQSEVKQSLEELDRINNKTAAALDTLEELINAKEEDKIGDLKVKNEENIAINNDYSEKTTDIKNIIDKMQDSIIESRKKRNLRKLRSHKKRQAEVSAKEEIIDINQQIDALIKDIEEYRDGDQTSNLELTHLKMEDYDSNVSHEVEQMTKEIKKLKKRYSEAKKKIENCLKDDCFREKMVFTSAELKSENRPEYCEN